LIQYITNKRSLLESKGMAAGFPSALAVSKADLEAKNVLQNKVMDSKGQLHEDNGSEYIALYDYISTFAKAGKIMYNGLGKADEYTVTRLISRMRGGGTPPAEKE
jgi:hypothetical protein